jgi:multidrug efflux pump subunit AcrA (membrane-fusion protein)
MLVRSPLKPFALIALLSAALIFATSCGGSKANVTNETANSQPAVVEVTTAAAIMRDLPKFFEATGSLTGDQQTDVAPSIAGKVVYIGVELGSFVKRGQTIVRLDDVDSKLRVQQAQAQLEQVKAALRQAEDARDNRLIPIGCPRLRTLAWQ